MIEENEQEELEVEEQEKDYGADVDTMIDAIRQKNLGQAKSHFEDIIGDKVNASLEAEKIRLANVVYNGASEEEEVEATDETSYEDADWEDITTEIEDSLEQ